MLKISRVYAYSLVHQGELKVERYGPKFTLVMRNSLVDFLRRRGSVVKIRGDELTIIEAKVPLDFDKIRDFCKRWYITEFALFGSVTREDFQPDSDIDVLVSFAPNSPVTLFSLPKMKYELEGIFRRKVDLVSRGGIESSRNSSRREQILTSAEVIYHAAA